MTIITSRVRKADRGDEKEVMALCRELHKENGLFTLTEEKVQSYLDRAFNRNGAIIGVIGERGRIEGAIYLMISDFWYSDDWHLAELFSYVLPQYRKSSNAKDLIAFAKRCALELKLPAVIGIISNERTEAKVNLYRRQLGTAVGAFFVFNGFGPTPATHAAFQAQQAAE